VSILKLRVKFMKVKTIKILPAKKENSQLFTIKDDTSCKLELTSDVIGYVLTYCNQNLGTYETNNPDLLLVKFLEALAEFNKGDAQNVKKRLTHLIDKNSIILNQQYPTTYKNNTLKYILGLENNIIKTACIEQNLTYQQLADAIGVSESSLRSSVSTNKVSKQVEKSIKMYLKIAHLEKELAEVNTIKRTLKSWLS